MAGYTGLASVGLSIVALLNRRFHALPEAVGVDAFLASANELKTMRTGAGVLIGQPAVSVYCYKVTVDRETRPGWSGVSHADGIPRIPLRMHLLVSAWATSAEEELRWLGLAAQVLEGAGSLGVPLLSPLDGWEPGESVQLVADDLSLDTISEAFQALKTDYRLSLSYIARVICIEGPAEPTVPPVATVAGRLEPQGAGR